MKSIYKVPIFAHLHIDNTWSYTDYLEVETSKEPKVIEKKHYKIGRNQDEHPLITFLLVYNNDEINQVKLNQYEVPQYEYLHYDNTITYSNFFVIESLNEPIVSGKNQVEIGLDEDGNPLIKYLLVYS